MTVRKTTIFGTDALDRLAERVLSDPRRYDAFTVVPTGAQSVPGEPGLVQPTFRIYYREAQTDVETPA